MGQQHVVVLLLEEVGLEWSWLPVEGGEHTGERSGHGGFRGLPGLQQLSRVGAPVAGAHARPQGRLEGGGDVPSAQAWLPRARAGAQAVGRTVQAPSGGQGGRAVWGWAAVGLLGLVVFGGGSGVRLLACHRAAAAVVAAVLPFGVGGSFLLPKLGPAVLEPDLNRERTDLLPQIQPGCVALGAL